MQTALPIDDRVTLPATDLTWKAVRASGPGGQNVNKVSSKVELRFDVPGTSALTDVQKERLRALFASRLDKDGWLVITSQDTRDQGRNLEDARDKLRALVAAALVVPKRRKATRPTFGSKLRRLDAKHHRAEVKGGRGKVRDE